jgi:hypothetical protein
MVVVRVAGRKYGVVEMNPGAEAKEDPTTTCESIRKLLLRLRVTNAQTPPKTEEHQRPESKTNQQEREPSEICKTSILGSNPGGASNPKLL